MDEGGHLSKTPEVISKRRLMHENLENDEVSAEKTAGRTLKQGVIHRRTKLGRGVIHSRRKTAIRLKAEA